MRDPYFLPLSALKGDNVVEPSAQHAVVRRPQLCWSIWKPSIPRNQRAEAPSAWRCSACSRPDATFRGYAGQIALGIDARPGDEIVALPPARRTRVKRIVTFDGDLEEARAPMSVTLTLEDEIDISRGDMIVSG